MRFLPFLLAALFFASCRATPKGETPVVPTPGSVAGGLVPGGDVATVDAFFKTHKTNAMVPTAAQTPAITTANSRFVVDLDGQRVYFYTDNKLTAAAALASGRKYYRTETGDYTIGQKNLNHRSNSYGNFVGSGGRTMMSDVKNGFDPTPPGARFEGSLMKYFMRFDHQGRPTAMGFHRGVLPGYPASHGCVRLPERAASWFFSKVPSGTPVAVRGSKLGVKYGAGQGRPKRSPKVHSSLKNKAVPTAPADPGAEPVGLQSPPATTPSGEPVPAAAPGASAAPAADPVPAENSSIPTPTEGVMKATPPGESQ